MHQLKAQDERVVLDERDETPQAQKRREHVNEVVEKLGDVVFDEPPAVAFPAMVSLLAIMLAAKPNALSETKDISAVLEALVRINLTREEAIVLYRM
jgi:hypothetical protein